MQQSLGRKVLAARDVKFDHPLAPLADLGMFREGATPYMERDVLPYVLARHVMPYMEDMFHIWQVRTVPYKRSYGTVHRTGIPYRMCTHTHSWKLATPRDYSRVMPYMEHPIVRHVPHIWQVRTVRRSKVKRSKVTDP